MKRLTKRINERYGPADIFCLEWIGACLCRLAVIEDILGDEYEIDRLRELVEADKEGRCVVLPCNVGDNIFCIMDKTINEMTVRGFRREASEQWKIVAFTDKNYPHWTEYEMDFNQIGDTIFLFYTEAESALKAREQE